MVGRAPGCLGIDPAEPKRGQIEFLDEDVDHPNGIVLADPVFQAFRKQRALSAIHALNEAPHPIPPANHARIIPRESYKAGRFHTARVNPRPAALRSGASASLRKAAILYLSRDVAEVP